MLIFELIWTAGDEDDDHEGDTSPEEQLVTMLTDILAKADISPDNYRLCEVLALSHNGPMLKIYGASFNPNLTRILLPLRQHLDIVLMEGPLHFLPKTS